MAEKDGILLLSMTTTKFKNTEIGRIPEDWEVKSIESITDVVTGATPSTAIPEYWGGDIRWMSSGELNDKFIYDVEGRITELGYANAGTHMLPVHCVLIGLAGQGKTRGTAAYNFVELCTNQSIGAILPHKSYDSLYLYYYINSLYTYLRILSSGDGGRGGLNKNLLLQLQIPFPPSKEEQSRIASALFDIDTLIRDLDRTIEKKKNIRQGAMEQLLSGKKRLPGFKGEWLEMKVSEIGKLSGAGVDKKSKPDEVPVRLVNFLDVYHRNRIAQCELHHWVTATPEKVLSCNVKRGDIFFTPSSEMPDDIGQSAVAVDDMENVCYSYHIYRLRPSITLDPDYGAYAFQNKYFFDQVKVESEGSGKRYVVSINKFKELYALLPPTLEEQRAIAATLTAMDDEIAVLQMERDKYANIRSGMMDDLLTGAKRI